jgi:hypothetical protein
MTCINKGKEEFEKDAELLRVEIVALGTSIVNGAEALEFRKEGLMGGPPQHTAEDLRNRLQADMDTKYLHITSTIQEQEKALILEAVKLQLAENQE